MAQIRLIPSTYAVSSTSHLSVSNASNMYTDTDSTTYATITNTYASTSSRYLYLRGFNFSDIPSNAIINSFTIKIKGYESGLSTSTSYAPRLANGTSAISNTTATTTFGTSSKTITIPTGSLTWSQIVNYGSNFTIKVYVGRSSRNTTGYFYCYGAEIFVDYAIPVYHTVSVSGDNVSPTGSQSVLEGESLTVKCYYDVKPTVTDNGTDVSNQLVQQQDSAESYSVSNVTTTYGFELNGSGYYESNNQGYSSTCALARVSFHLPVSATITFSVINYAERTDDFGLLSELDEELSTSASADSSNVYWSGKNNNSSSVQTVTYSNVAAGDHTIDVKYFKDNHIDDYNDSLQFKVEITLLETPTYSPYWAYILSNITADHTIVVTEVTDKLLIKYENAWVEAAKVFKKVNGSWVEQSDLTTVFDSGTNYKYG